MNVRLQSLVETLRRVGLRRLRIVPLLAIATLLCIAAAGCKSTPPTASVQQAAAAAASAPVRFNPGDVVQVSFPGAPPMNTTERVRVDGKILMPLVGEVVAAGKTPAELQSELASLYAGHLQVTEVVVIMASSSASIFVTGAVNRPGRIAMERPLTVLDAIMEAGGFDPRRANLRKVAVIRQEKGRYSRHTMNLKPVVKGENVTPFWLQPFDTVYVPEKIF